MVYKFRNDGSIWFHWRGTWQSILGPNPSSGSLAGGANTYRLDKTGDIYELHISTPLLPLVPPFGAPHFTWTLLGSDPKTTALFSGITGALFQHRGNGEVLEYVSSTGWRQIDYRQTIRQIVYICGYPPSPVPYLIELRDDNTIWVYVGGATGWFHYWSDSAAARLIAGSNELYELRTDGSLNQLTGGLWVPVVVTPIDRDTLAKDYAVGITVPATVNEYLYKLRTDGSIWEFDPSGGGWTAIRSADPSTIAIAAEKIAGPIVYGLFTGGTIRCYTPGISWSIVDSDPGIAFIGTIP